MRFPLSLRVAHVCALATLLVFLGSAPSFAHMGGSPGLGVRPGTGFGHFQQFSPHGFNRRPEPGRFGFNRFGPTRCDRFGFNRFNRYDGNQLFGGGWGWGGYSASAAPAPFPAGDDAPVINIGVYPGPGDGDGAWNGGCVIHKLNYDNTGKYVGERQIPQC
jgi:hypothetical protein